MSTALRGIGLGKRIGRATVFRDVDLEVPSGALVRIAGGNGSGKSTLIRVLAGVSVPTHGRVLTDPVPRAILPERFVGPERFTPVEYLTHMGRIRGLDPTATRQSTTELVAALGLDAHAQTRIGALSKGNAQKVAVAQAFLEPPTGLLFLDEPNTGLDDAAAATLNRLVQDAQRRGCAVVLCEHEHSRTARPDVTYRLHGGTLRAVDDTADQTTTAVVTARRPTASADRRVDVPGCGPVEADGYDPVSARLGREHVDDALRALLASGWSVLEVRVDPEHGEEATGWAR